MNLDWRISASMGHLVAFETAVDEGSFTKAAQALGTTQPSVSRHIASLENLLEVKLFHRLHHRVKLTDDGRELYEAVKLGLGHIRQAARRINTPHNTNILSIGCTYGFAHLWLMPRFSALQEVFPDHELRMVTSDTRTIFDLNEVDFALRFGEGDWRDGGSRKLFNEQLFPVCSQQYALEHFGGHKNVKPDQLIGATLIHERPEKYSWLSWQQWLTRKNVTYEVPKNTYYYDNYTLTLQAAAEGKGVALAWLHLAQAPSNTNQLVEIEGMRVKTDRGYYLAYRHNHQYADKVVSWFKTMVKSQE